MKCCFFRYPVGMTNASGPISLSLGTECWAILGFYKANLQIKIKMRCLFPISRMPFHVETIRGPQDNHGVCLNLAGVYLRIVNFILCNHFRIQGFGYPCLRSCRGVACSPQRSQASRHAEKVQLLAGVPGKSYQLCIGITTSNYSMKQNLYAWQISSKDSSLQWWVHTLCSRIAFFNNTWM